MADPRGQPAGFGALVSPSLSYAGVDQGIDFTGSGIVYALGDGIVTRVKASGSGWPGQGAVVNYRITSGPAAGRYVYVAEDFVPAAGLKPGSRVSKGQPIGSATGSGLAPGIEIGWAQPNGLPLAPRPPARPAPQYTPAGENFRQFVATGNNSGFSLPSDLAAGAQHIPGVVQGEAVVGAAQSTAQFLGHLTDPHYILRGLQIFAGGALVAMGLYLLVRQVGLATSTVSLPTPLEAGANAVAAASPTEREARYHARRPAPRRETIRTGPQPVYGRRRGTEAYGEVPF